jgi:PAS domain-containing protein
LSPRHSASHSIAEENMHLDRLARTRLRVLDSTIEGIYQVDPEGRCTFMNRAACCMLGYQFGEALGKMLHELHSVGSDSAPVPAPDGRCPDQSSSRMRKKYRA